MDVQNITLSVPKNVLIKIKHLAVEQGTSVSKLMSESMINIINNNYLYEKAKKSNLKKINSHMNMGTKGEINIEKEDLHE